jgi:protein subunit release factor B
LTARSPFRPEHKRKNWFLGIDAIEPVDETCFREQDDERLVAQLETEAASTHLPEEAACRDALNDLLVRVRLPSKQTEPAVGSRLP